MKKKFLPLLLLVTCYLLPVTVLADDATPTPKEVPQPQLPTSEVEKTFSAHGLIGQLLTVILPIIIGVAGFITVIIIVISGIQFITSGGDPKGVEAARSRLTYAIIGFILIILSFAILQIINTIFLGASIV